MTQPDLVQLAKTGDGSAIATLLQRAFQPEAVSVKVSLKDNQLKVLLEALPLPEPETALTQLQQEFTQLEIDCFSTIQVYGRILGAARPSWQKTLTLGQVPPIGTLHTPVPPQSTQPGELQALDECHPIAMRLNQALAHKQATVKVSLAANCLTVMVSAIAPPEQQSTVILIDRELSRLNSLPVTQVRVEGHTIADSAPIWQEEFALGARSRLPTVQRTADSPSIQPQSNQTLPLRPCAISKEGWSALLTGLVLAIGLMTIGLLRVVFYGFIVLVHEVGHAAAYWLFGQPAIPSVDLLNGGGVTLTFGRVGFIVVLIYLGLSFLFYYCRNYPRLQGILALFTLIYSICLFTSLSNLLPIAMGHGMELIAIAACLYFAVSGYFCRFAGDRSIYAMLGFYTLFSRVQFSWQLIHDLDIRSWYEGGKGGIDSDLVIVADQYLRLPLSTIAHLFLLACIAAPVIAWALFRYENWWKRGVEKVFAYRKSLV